MCLCPGPTHHSGREFVFGVSENGVFQSVIPEVFIYITNPNTAAVDVTLEVPRTPQLPPFPIHVSVLAYGRQVYSVSQTDLVVAGTGVNDRGIRVTANLDILVQVSNCGYLTSDTFMVYPTASLGTR